LSRQAQKTRQAFSEPGGPHHKEIRHMGILHYRLHLVRLEEFELFDSAAGVWDCWTQWQHESAIVQIPDPGPFGPVNSAINEMAELIFPGWDVVESSPCSSEAYVPHPRLMAEAEIPF
jgi:hypothetical protein